MACSKKTTIKARLDGKTAIVTGGNTGIGKETARGLVERGARVIITARDEKKGREAAEDIATADTFRSNAVVFKTLKLDSLASIRKFAGEILESEPQIHILINNAGVMDIPQSKTEDGFESQFGINYLGHFYLTNLLLGRLKASAPARIISLSSDLHASGKINFDDLMMETKYDSEQAYCQSKLATILFTKELAARLQGTAVTTYAVHPGIVKTEILRNTNSVKFSIAKYLFRPFFLTPAQGAATSIYCASDESLKDQTGLYYYNRSVTEPSKMAQDMEVAHRLWDVSSQLVGLEVN